jgi:hypothetical protein
MITQWTNKTDPWSASRATLPTAERAHTVYNAHVSQPSRLIQRTFFCILAVASTAQ